MRKLFNFKKLVALIIVLSVSTSCIFASAVGGSAGGGSSGGSSSGGKIDYVEIETDTFFGDNVYGTVSIKWWDDVNYGVNFLIYAEGDNLPEQLLISAELFDADGNRLTNELTDNSFANSNVRKSDCYFDYALENRAADYIVKFFVCDESGQALCEEQTVTLSYDVCDIRYGYVAGFYTSGINPVTTLEILDENGQLNEFSFASKPVVNNIAGTKVDGEAIVGKFAKFELNPSTDAIRRLSYYDSADSDNRCSLFTIPDVSNDIYGVYVPYDTAVGETHTICSSFNNGLLSNLNIQQTTEFGSFFIFRKECSDIKVMYLESLSTLVPVCDSSNFNLFSE